MKDLVNIAFHLSYYQISGGAPWTEHENYTVEAKPPTDLRPPLTNLRHSWWDISDPRLREMLQALVIDRFQLKFHTETKTGVVYVLEKGGKKLKLQPTDDKRWPPNPTGNTRLSEVDFVSERFYVINESMPQLAKFAADYVLRAPVLDRTDLNGSFDYTEPPPLDERDPATIDFAEAFKAMIHDIGLKLVRSEGSVESFVIDHAERPSAN